MITPYGKQSMKRGKSSIFLPNHPHVKKQICIESEKIKKTKTSVFSKNPSEKTDVLGNTKFLPRRQIWFFTRKNSFFLSSRWTLQLSVFSLSAWLLIAYKTSYSKGFCNDMSGDQGILLAEPKDEFLTLLYTFFWSDIQVDENAL